MVYYIWVIPGEINKEFRLTFRISTKFGVLIAYIEVITALFVAYEMLFHLIYKLWDI